MDERRKRDWRAYGAAGSALLVLALVLQGCGAPKYNYVGSREHHTVFRVPAGWTLLSEKKIESELYSSSSASDAVQAQHTWSVGYDASTNPTVGHIFGTVASAPVVYETVQDLNESARAGMSFDMMRDLFLPVSASARQNATSQGSTLTGFELLRDDTITGKSGERGVHVQFNYTLGNEVQTFDQTVYVDQDTTHAYIFFVRCTAQCFKDRKGELDDVIDSFSVKK